MVSLLRRSTAPRPFPLLALGTALLLALLLALPLPAQAHDTLLSSDPEDGASLETSPEAITLTFSADVLAVSPLVRITDESGAQLAEIVPAVDGATATATLEEPLPAGAHTIQWRVVSSDGHPIEGSFTITVAADAPAAAASDGGAEGAPAASDAGGAESAPQQTEQPEQDGSGEETSAAEPAEPAGDQGGMSMPVLLGILAVVVIGAVVAGVAIVRRRD